MASTEQRKQWCYEKAREFFNHKNNITKRYKVDYFYPEVDITDWLIFTEKEVETYRQFEQKEREDFLHANPNDANNNEKWQDWLDDAYLDANFTIQDYPENGLESEVRRVYLDQSKNTYSFRIAFLNEEKGTFKTKRFYIDLGDEEYIRLLALFLDDDKASMSEIWAKEPEIFQKIASQCFLVNTTCAFFMDEIKQDARYILDANGSNMPKY